MLIFSLAALLFLLPFLDGGTDTVSAFLMGLTCFFLAIFFWLKRKEKLPVFPILAWLIFLLFASFSTAFSISLARSLPQLAQYLFYFLFFLSIYILAQSFPGLIKWLAGIVITASIALTLLSFYYLFAFPRFGPPGLSTMNLVYASFGHNHLSDYLLFSLPLVLVLSLSAKKRKFQLLFGLILVLLLVGFISTFARGAFFVILPVLLFIFLFIKTKVFRGKKVVVFLTFILPVVALISILALSLITSIVPSQSLGLQVPKLFSRQLFKPIVFEPRFHYWQQAVWDFKSSPFFGTGLDTFRYQSFRTQRLPVSGSWYTTNHFLQMFSETGIFGGVGFIVLIGTVLFLTFKRIRKRKDPLLIALFGGLLASILHSFFDWDWQFPAVFLTFWAISAVLLGPKTKEIKIKFVSLLLPILAIMLSLFFMASVLADFYSDQKSERSYLTALRIYPFKTENYEKLALIYRKEERFDEAVEVLKKGLRLDFPNGLLQKELGGTYALMGDYQEAEREMKLAIEANPLDNADFYLELAEIYEKRGKDKEEALLLFIDRSWRVKDFNLAARKAGRVYFALAKLYFDRGEEKKAFTIFSKLVNDIAWSFPYHQKLGVLEKAQLLFDQKRYDDAKELLEGYTLVIEGLKFEDFGDSHHYVGENIKLLSEIYFIVGERQKGIDTLKKTIEADPWVSEYYLELAKKLIEEDREFEAGGVYQRCLEFFPENEFCRRGVDSVLRNNRKRV